MPPVISALDSCWPATHRVVNYEIAVQPYQDNYYHFVAESLPRLIMARDIMLQDPSVRLLTRDQPFIRQARGPTPPPFPLSRARPPVVL